MRRISQFLALLLMCQLMYSTTLLANNSFYRTKISTVKANLNTVDKIPTSTDALITRHSPKLNGQGRVEGSIRILLGESFDINGDATVTGDIYVPGSPDINRTSNANYKEIVKGNGNAQPSNYTIKLNGSSSINRIITHTDSITVNSVPIVPQTNGTRDVELLRGDKPGDFSTIRDLILSRHYNLMLEVPAGTYGNFRAHRRSGFILGVDNQETTYNLESLELNTQTRLQVRGKVTINIKNRLTLNSNAKMGQKITDLLVNIEVGGATLNSNSEFYGTLNAPSGTLTLNANSKLFGSVICDIAKFNSTSLLKYVSN